MFSRDTTRKDNKLTIQNPFYPPQYGKTDLKYLNDEPTRKQKDLLPNTPSSKRRVLGSAGSGKTFILVRKALDAAKNNQRVLFVTFNITMANLLRDLVFRLSRYYGPNVHRNIEVAHYHRLIYGTTDETTGQDIEQRTLSAYRSQAADVLLIDEGQDFQSDWVSNLLEICREDSHVMFVEDDRQNIYNRTPVRLASFKGRPNLLSETHRVPPNLSKLANALYDYYKLDNESGALEPIKKNAANYELFRPAWLNANDYEEAKDALLTDLNDLWQTGRFGQPADTAILFCQVNNGWDVEAWLERNIKAPRNRMFESQKEAEQLRKKYGINIGSHNEMDTEKPSDEKITSPNAMEDYLRDLRSLRRKYKVLFRMRNDGIKLSTIHSFKTFVELRLDKLCTPYLQQNNFVVIWML